MQTIYKYALYNHYDIAVQFDGDGQHNIEYVSDIIEPIIKEEVDFCNRFALSRCAKRWVQVYPSAPDRHQVHLTVDQIDDRPRDHGSDIRISRCRPFGDQDVCGILSD